MEIVAQSSANLKIPHTSPRKTLAPEDEHRLTVRSSIDPAIVEARGCYTEHDPAALAALGFADYQCLAPALVIPLITTAGVQVGYLIRPHHPRIDPKSAKPIKYESAAGSPSMIDAGPDNHDLKNPAVAIYFCESPAKRDAMATRGFCAVAIKGVWGFLQNKLVIEDFRDIPLKGRDAVIVYDSDVTSNPKVMMARDCLAAALQRRGARVTWSDLPTARGDEKQGVDDYFANGRTRDDFLATIRDLPAAESSTERPTLDEAVAELVADLEAKVATLEDELRTERAERADERRILGDSRRHAQERIAAVLFAWEARRVAQHGTGELGRGGGLSNVIAVDETGSIYTSVKGMAISSGTSPKNMGEYFAKWQSEGLMDRSVTRIRAGETTTRDGEIKTVFESTARIRPRGNLGDFLHDMYMAAPKLTPRAKPKPKDRCADHPDADLIRRTTTECSVCHVEVAPERAVWVPAGTPPEQTEHNAAIDFDGQNTPAVTSENAPQVISEHRPSAPPSSAPTSPLSHRRLFLESSLISRAPVDRYTDVTIGGRK